MRTFKGLPLALILFLAFFSSQHVCAQSPDKKIIKIACIGNSITYGSGINNRDKDSYPAVLGQMLGTDYEVRNWGISARTMLNKGQNPYMKEPFFQDALQYNPDIVIIKLGTNDSKSHNWKYKNDYKKDMETMVGIFQSLPSKPKIYLCYPAKAYNANFGVSDSIIVHEIIPTIKSVAASKKAEVIDLHTAMDNMIHNFPDGIHPNEAGAFILAGTIYRSLTGKDSNHTPQAFAGVKSRWAEYDRYDFKIKDRDAIVVVPQKAAEGRPWIWRPAFFGAFASVDKALLDKGFHVVYYDLTHLYGSPRAVRLGTDFYNNMTTYYNLSPKVTLEGFSRGGLFVFNWAAANADKIACIYVDAPVCDVFSWPGRKNAKLWSDLLKEWNLTDEQMSSFKGNPIDILKPIAKAGIPIVAVCGDADQTVPFRDNMDVVRSRYLTMGGSVNLIIKEGVDHHPHSLDNPEPVVNFILRNQSAYKAKQHLTTRGSIINSRIKFEKERKVCVAFIGGSITEMNGWSSMIQQELKQRFPYTEFEFINAGIGSTGSTPGAFRLENDVLSKAKIDLLFVEAAVNDDTNGFNPEAQIRGMEGQIRHALNVNLETDIIMLHFIYDPFISTIEGGRTPDVILNHERVANHYLIPTINLAQEITERMQVGEFTWDEFGGTHPKPLGHRYYTAAIANLFDQMWMNIPSEMKTIPHSIPQQPLDEYSYSNGRFMDIRAAKIGKGWSYIPEWNPKDKAGKRKGFVDVPMIEAKTPKAQLSLNFKGKAIGVFCVSGPSVAIIEYSIDDAPFKTLDTYTAWSKNLYIPWLYILEDQLEDTNHKLELRISKDKNKNSQGTECQIRNFVVN